MADTFEEIWINLTEISVLILLLFGIITALSLNSPWLNYFIITLSGLVSGHIIYEEKKVKPIFPMVAVIIGFFVGFLIGSGGTNRIALTVLFAAGNIITWQMHKRGIIPLEFELFDRGEK